MSSSIFKKGFCLDPRCMSSSIFKKGFCLDPRCTTMGTTRAYYTHPYTRGTLRLVPPTRVPQAPSFLLSHSLSPPLYSLSPPLSQQKINKKVAKQTNTETASTAAHGTRRKPRCCGRCRLHGVDVRAEGHQGSCPHVKCGCKPCVKLVGSLSRQRERSRPLKRRREVRRV